MQQGELFQSRVSLFLDIDLNFIYNSNISYNFLALAGFSLQTTMQAEFG